MNTQKVQANDRTRLTQRFSAARIDLLLVIALTILNVVMLFSGSETMMLFSASLPYYGLIFAAVYDVMTVGVAIAVGCLALYFLCWLLSKKNPVWLIVATALFVVDTLFLVWLYVSLDEVLSGTVDLIIHALVLYYLISGYVAANKLKGLPEETAEVPDASTLGADSTSETN